MHKVSFFCAVLPLCFCVLKANDKTHDENSRPPASPRAGEHEERVGSSSPKAANAGRPTSPARPHHGSPTHEHHHNAAGPPYALLFEHEMLVVDRRGDQVPATHHLYDKVLMLLFSASWCGPCQQLTPKLKKLYEAVKARGDPLEVVFVSSDESAGEQLEYYRDKMGEWAYLEYGNDKINELKLNYGVRGIPALFLIKSDGSISYGEHRECVKDLLWHFDEKNPLATWDSWMTHYNAADSG